MDTHDRRTGGDRRVAVRGTSERRRGRPRVVSDGPCSHVTTRIPTVTHDTLIKEAGRRHISVSEYVRRVLIFQLGKAS